MYEKTVKKLSTYIAQELKLTETDKDKIRFAIELVLSTIISILGSIILARILGIFIPVILILGISGFLKLFAGGVHLKNVGECAIFTAIFSNTLGLLSVQLSPIIYSFWPLFMSGSSIFIFISLFLWSPYEVPEKPIKEERKAKLKKMSMIIELIILLLVTISFLNYQNRFLLVNTSIIIGVLFHSLTINPITVKLLNYYYHLKKTID